MKIMNWTEVEESTKGGAPLPPGGYVARIVDVEDVPGREYLWIMYDIAEGEHAGHYSDDFAKNNPWCHRFSRSYKQSAQGMFKAFLMRLQESNPGRFDVASWQATGDERAFVGLEVGLVMQTEKYTNNKGEDKERLDVVGIYASQDIRNGLYNMPEPKDTRKPADPFAMTAADPYANDAALPF